MKVANHDGRVVLLQQGQDGREQGIDVGHGRQCWQFHI